MRYLTPADILMRVSETLEYQVLPECAPAGRGQLYAAIGLLQNVAMRIEERVDIREDEATRLAEVLEELGLSDTSEPSAALLNALGANSDVPPSMRVIRIVASALEDIELAQRPFARPTRFADIFRQST